MKRRVLVSLLFAAATVQAQVSAPPNPGPVAASAEGAVKSVLRPLDVLLNQAPMGQWTLLERDGALYASPDTLQEWRLMAPKGTPSVNYRGNAWLPLFALPGYRARFDFSSQSVDLEFASTAFVGTRLANETEGPPALSPAAPAFFLNYDVSHTASNSAGSAFQQDTGALTEFGLALGMGTLISSAVGTNLGNSRAGQAPQWQRLETTWTQDFQDKNHTLRVGDTSSRPSMWGRSLYFGGLQFGSNFGLTPGFLSQPIPNVSGTANSASTVELYVNNALRQTSNVPAGPFTIENLTQLTGAGEARVVVRDLLGRESLLVKQFFVNSNLLKPGLTDWSVSLGRERYNLGTESADYRDAFTSAMFRSGITDSFTLEGQANGSQTRQDLGLGVNIALPFQALGQMAFAHSQDGTFGAGSKLLFGVDQQSLRSGFSARVVLADSDFRELGFGPTELPYQREQSINYRYSFGDQASISLGAARLESYKSVVSNVLSASYSLRVGARGALVFSGTQVSGNNTGYMVGVSLVLPLESNKTVTASATRSESTHDGYIAVTSPLSSEVGIGWRALAGGRADNSLTEGGIYYQGGKAYLGADLSVAGSAQTLRLNAQGALVAMAGAVFAARRLDESFALVEVAGYPDVGVGFQGEALTRTDSKGQALLPRLAAYQRNNIRLDPNDLPFSAELDSIEQVAVPAWRSGVKVTFPVRSGRGALIRLLFDDGVAAPAGARIELVGDNKAFFVARRGEAYVTGLQSENTLQLKWKDQSCSFNVTLPPNQADDIPRLGPLLCKGVVR